MQSVPYEQVRDIAGDSAHLQASFAGAHRWFLGNRGDEDVTVTLRIGSQYNKLRNLN